MIKQFDKLEPCPSIVCPHGPGGYVAQDRCSVAPEFGRTRETTNDVPVMIQSDIIGSNCVLLGAQLSRGGASGVVFSTTDSASSSIPLTTIYNEIMKIKK